MCRAVGLDDESEMTRGYLITLASLEFARTREHLSCRHCSRVRDALASPYCPNASAHDWVIAR
jgi:hypothetical protein